MPIAPQEIDEDFADFIICTCEYNAGRTVGWSAARHHDRIDLAGELMADVVAALGRHDPAKGTPEALVNVVASTRRYSWLRKQYAKKRAGTAVSLEMLQDTPAAKEPDPLEREELETRVRRAQECLDEDDRLACEHIALGGSVAAAARTLNVSRDRVRAARRRALVVFESEALCASGLREEDGRDTRCAAARSGV